MEEYRRGAHAVYDIKYHLIWITKRVVQCKMILNGGSVSNTR